MSIDLPHDETQRRYLLEAGADWLVDRLRKVRPELEVLELSLSPYPLPCFRLALPVEFPISPHDIWKATEVAHGSSDGPHLYVFSEGQHVCENGTIVRQEILGTTAVNATSLAEITARVERALESDHRWSGRDQSLFLSFGSRGGITWLPMGRKLREDLRSRVETELERGGFALCDASEDDPSEVGPGRENQVRAADRVYASGPRGVSQTPIRLAEWHSRPNALHRPEHGLRGCPSENADLWTSYCVPSQIDSEIEAAVRRVHRLYASLGLKLAVAFEESPLLPGNLLDLLRELGITRTPLIPGKGIDGTRADARLDFFIPNLFGIFEHRAAWIGAPRADASFPLVGGRPDLPRVARIVEGSLTHGLERLTAGVLEHYRGSLPLWLAPVQILVISLSPKNSAYGLQVHRRLEQAGFRSELDARVTKVMTRERGSLNRKIPYTLILGPDEEIDSTLCIRRREHFSEREVVPLAAFLETLKSEIRGELDQDNSLAD